MILANTDKEITLIYHSKEHAGRQILTYAKAQNMPVHDIDLAHTKLTPSQWVGIYTKMGIEVKELINTDNPEYIEKFGDITELSEHDWLTILVHNPEILKAPIVMKGDKIVFMSNPQDMLHFS